MWYLLRLHEAIFTASGSETATIHADELLVQQFPTGRPCLVIWKRERWSRSSG
jgi:hypothetical protein